MAPVSSFAPEDMSSGRWDGGPATITNPHFEYRTFTYEGAEQRVVDCRVVYLDSAGGEHPGAYNVGNTTTRNGEEILVIRETADENAPEAEIGLAFSHVDPAREYKLRADSEFGKYVNNLVVAGVSKSDFATGDISVIDGLEVFVTPTPRKEGDKFPLLLVTEVLPKAGKRATGRAAATSARPAARAAAPAARRAAAGTGAEEPEIADAAELSPEDEAVRDLILDTMGEKTSVGVADCVRAAARMKDAKVRNAVIKRLNTPDAVVALFADTFTFNKRSKAFELAT